MLTAEVEALAAIGDGAHQHRLMGAEVVAGIGLRQFLAMVTLYGYQVEDRGGEVLIARPSWWATLRAIASAFK